MSRVRNHDEDLEGVLSDMAGDIVLLAADVPLVQGQVVATAAEHAARVDDRRRASQ